MSKPHHKTRGPARSRRRERRAGDGERHHHPAVALTDEGFPAAVPDAPRPSPVVFVSDDALARYPWLPRRVIAGSVWRGPKQERVRVDESGNADLWRCGPRTGP